MQKSSNNNNANNVFVVPRDHFLDNAGMSESDSDLDSIEEGMLIEAPVTPEKSLPAPGLDGSSDLIERQPVADQEGDEDPAERQQTADQEGDKGSIERQQTVEQEGEQGSLERPDAMMADGNAGIAGQAGNAMTADIQDTAKDKEVGPACAPPVNPQPRLHAY